MLEDKSGVIEEVEEHKRAIIRLDPRPQGVYQQVLLANADQAVFVFALRESKSKIENLGSFPCYHGKTKNSSGHCGK